MNHIKRRLLFMLLFCLVVLALTACSPKLPSDTDIIMGLSDYYNQYDSNIHSIDILDDHVDKKNDVAYRTCIVTAVSNDGSFQITDSWEITYFLWDKTWEITDTALLSSEYALLEGLSESDCRSLLHDVMPKWAQINSIDSDLENFSATAIYTYHLESAPFGNYSTCITDGTGTANFSWDVLDRWTRSNLDVEESNIYNAAFNLLILEDRRLPSDRFRLNIDVTVEDNIPTIAVNEFSMDLSLLGPENLSFHDVQIVKNESEDAVDITFSYVRDIDGIENKEGYSTFYAELDAAKATQGRGYIRLSGADSTKVFFENWQRNTWGVVEDYFAYDAHDVTRSPLS